MELFEKIFDIEAIIFVAIAVCFLVEFIKVFFTQLKNTKWILLATCVLFTLLRVPYELTNVSFFVANILFTLSFAFIFYTYLGKWAITFMVNKIKSKIETKVE